MRRLKPDSLNLSVNTVVGSVDIQQIQKTLAIWSVFFSEEARKAYRDVQKAGQEGGNAERHTVMSKKQDKKEEM